MKLVPIESTLDIMAECFPEVKQESLIKFRDQFVAFRFWNVACCLLYPYQNGTAISYIGVKANSRRLHCASNILKAVEDMSDDHPVYAEVIPGTVMYDILLKRGWYKIPIKYICPPWGSEPADSSRDLLCSRKDADHISFIREFYKVGYHVENVEELIRLYRYELKSVRK